MIIEIALVDVVMIVSSALCVILRASRHMTYLAAQQLQHQAGVDSVPVVTSACDTTRAARPVSPSKSPSQGPHNAAGASSRLRFAIGKLRLPTLFNGEQQSHGGGTRSVGVDHFVTQWPDVLHSMLHASHTVVLQRMSNCANVLALISNSLTHLLRHSEVLYALFLTSCDALLLSRERPSSRLTLLGLLAALLCVLTLFNERGWWFWFGDWCGYTGGVVQLILLGATLGGSSVTVLPAASNCQASLLSRTLAAEFVMERVAACVSSTCYLIMLTDEGDAVYSCHMEFIRWYGGTTAALLIDATQLYRFLRGRKHLDAD